MNNTSKLLAAAVIGGGLIWLTASVRAALTPFIFAAVIAYISAPLAQKLENRSLPPAVVASLVVLLALLLIVTLPLALLPLIAAQVREFAELLPLITQKIHAVLGSSLADWIEEQDISMSAISGDKIHQTVNFAADLFGSGLAALSSSFTILLITPLAAFYFLRDRKSISGELTEILPPHIRDRALIISRDLDNVLGEFLRGQLIVMTIMALYYSIALKLAALPFALTIGIISGLLTFIPYFGFILGVILATLVGASHFESFLDVAIIWLLMGIGTVVESVLITPRLVGERVGLHPLGVLLALLVMGELFGFLGVLAALPAAAALLVCWRHLRRYYIGSDFYGRQ